jgi:hypothetical protein
MAAILHATPAWMDNLQEGYKDDVQAHKLITELCVTPNHTNEEGFALTDGLLRYKGRIWVGINQLAHQHILQALHNSGMGGHSGIRATYERVKQFFA